LEAIELVAATCHLRSLVQVLRGLGESCTEPGGSSQVGHRRELMREVARTAREVEAWGAQLLDSSAVAASQEAYQTLALVAPQLVTEEKPYWSKAGALVCLQVRHDTNVDANQLVHRLKRATLKNIISNPPCSPLQATVGLLATDDQALLSWTAKLQESSDSITTMAPFLVTLLFHDNAQTGAAALIRHVESVTTVDHFCKHVPCPARTARVVVALSERLVSLIEHRCLGSPVYGRCVRALR
jgi:hypothetical protein